MNQAQALYQLQILDQDISQRKLRLTQIEQLLGEDTRVLDAKQTAGQAETDLSPWRTQVQNLDLEIKAIAAKTDAVNERLYSGRVTNPKELQDMQEEVASLKRRRSKLEDELLEAMIQVETHQQILEDAQTNLAEVISRWESDQHDLIAERDRINSELTRLREHRAVAKTDIAPASLELYKRSYRNKQGQVVSLLKDSNCQYCGVGQTTKTVQEARQARDLVVCENCGRILVVL